MSIEKYKMQEEESIRWLDMYRKTILGFSAFAEQYSEGCDREWLCLYYGLESLAETMQQDIDARRENLKSVK